MNILIIPLIFITMSVTYFYISFNNKTNIPEEHIIIGIPCILLVSLCFVLSNMGFLYLGVIIIVCITYMAICYAGTKSVLRNLYKLKSPDFYRLRNAYMLLTTGFGIIILSCAIMAISFKSNLFVIMPKAFIPVYTGLLLYYTIKYKKSEMKKFIFNFNIFTFAISIYEWMDFIVYLSDMKFYSFWNEYYYDRTQFIDTIWLISTSIGFVFIPRIIFNLKKR